MKNSFFRCFFFGCIGLISILLGVSPLLIAQEKLDIESQSYQFDTEKNHHVYIKPVVKSKDLTVNGNRLEYSEKEKWLTFSGNIIATTADVFMTAARADYDQSTGVFRLFDATLFDRKRGAYVKAGQITRSKKQQFIINDTTITLCRPEDPAWEITSSRVVYNIDAYAYATHTVLTMKGVPALYLPILSWPTKKGRASGLLAPDYLRKSSSDSSKAYGNRIQLPYFIAIDEDHDATVTADLIQKRGVGLGMEYRYAFTKGMKGQFNGWYLDEFLNDRVLENENISGYNGSGDYDQSPSRYRFHFNHKQKFFFGGTLLFNYIKNSDNEVNREFFESDVTLDTHERKALTVSFPFFNGSLTLSADQTDKFVSESIYDKDTDKDTYLNQLPSIGIHQTFSQIGDTPLSLTLSNTATDYQRKYSWEGVVNQLNLTATAPFNLDFLNFSPEYEARYFYYDIQSRDTPGGDYTDGTEKKDFLIGRAKVGLDFEFFRYFYNKHLQKDGKLSFIPRLTYEHLDDVEQSASGILSDVYGRKSLTYHLKTLYKTKNLETEKVRDSVGLDLIQTYDLYRNHRFVGPETEDAYKETSSGDARLPLRLTLSVSPTPTFSASLFYRYDWEKESVVERTFSFSNRSFEGNTFSLSYNLNKHTYYTLDRNYKPQANAYTISHALKLPNNLDLAIKGVWDMSRSDLAQRYANSSTARYLKRQLTEASVALAYTHSCYKFLMSYTEDIETKTTGDLTEEYLENRITFTFTLSSWPGDSPYSFNHFFNN